MVRAGVPQGSVLGPVLYTLFTSDLPSPNGPGTLLATYADDTAFLVNSPCRNEASRITQEFLDSYGKWTNRVDLHHIAIPQAPQAQYLGLILDKRLTWKQHTTKEAIEQLDPAELHRSTRFELEELFIQAKVCVQEQLGPEANSTGINESTVNFGHTTAVKLPRLALPTFDGKYCEYQNFITSFNQVVGHQPSMSKIEKFNQLLNCLRGPALETVRAFQVTVDNYTKALDRLKQRYDNPTLVFLDNISSLFALPTAAKANGQQLRSLIDNASALYNSLRSLGNETQICQAMLISIVMGKVDQETKRKWNESLDYTVLPSWDNCVQVVERHCQYLESDKKPAAEASMVQPGGHRSRSQRNQANHKTFRCPELINLALENRLNAVKRYKLCINCLGKNHLVANCPSTQRCRTCALAHHTLLHRPSPGSTATPLPQPQAESAQVSDAVTHTHTEPRSDCVILATALVLVKDASGCYKIGRALLDSCSQVNFISEEFAQSLRLPRSKRNLEIRSIGETQTQIKHHTTTNIKSRHNHFELLLDFCVTSHIAYHPDSEIDISSWNLPQHSSLADEHFNKSRRIDLLLGTETFFDILAVGQVKLGKDLPVLQKTLLGWIVSGRCRAHPRTLHQYSAIVLDKIDENLERLWRIDHVVTPENTLTPEQRNCEEFYTTTVRRNSDGRVEVRLPFKDAPTALGASFDIARRRFLSLERNLGKRPEVWAKYVQFMQEFQDLGHMSLVSHPQLNAPHYYIPHHCVLKPNSTSTKLRVVFDASCKTTSQKSLNDLLMVGPTIQPDLYTLLLRFHIHRYAITADVVKMFRQVNVSAQDRRFQYILWRASPSQPLSTFELNTVTYGTAAAPYLAIRSMSYLADHFMNKLRIGAEAIKSSFYVDDFLGGSDTVEELHQIKREVTTILQDGQLELAKWHSNHYILSRGCTIAELEQSIWFEGPEFLRQEPQYWPRDNKDINDIDLEAVQLEKRKSAFAVQTTSNQLLEGVYKSSSYQRCLLVVAWMFRFIHRCRKLTPSQSPSPTPTELQRALHCIVWNIQTNHFAQEISSVLKGQPIRTNLKNLSLFLQVTDGFQLLKVGGRLELADYPETQRHPVLLPAKDPFVSQFVRRLHLQNYHAGPRTLVGLIRRQFWIVNARDLARQVVRSCIHCRRYRPTLEKQLMGQLPKERITPSRPFSRCGIDFCGPINVYLRIRGKPPTKAYLAVFVCFATKAIHVEVVSDLTTDSFIASLKRFIARRGLPSDIFCDNATNFAGANNKLEALKQFLFKKETAESFHHFCRNEFINFHFIPPRAPHFGGIWEAAVKSVKGLLNRTLRDTRLTFEELATAAADVEAILNSRPLTPLSTDPNDLAALTPGHFLVGDALRALPEAPPIDDNLDKLDRWKKVSAIKHHIWSRWSHEYVNELQVRTTWTKTAPNLAVNDMVIVHEDNLPPQRWLLGRVVSTIAGSDNIVRVANVRTAKGIIRRPIRKLALLPVS
ncbi:uncharacterized protein [Drosophila kikkawai]|uniref:Endonuclease n=1 Tax=Drosophila kikkawai TaxID=30033 RepID=A0ABM4GHN7_DROKI